MMEVKPVKPRSSRAVDRHVRSRSGRRAVEIGRTRPTGERLTSASSMMISASDRRAVMSMSRGAAWGFREFLT